MHYCNSTNSQICLLDWAYLLPIIFQSFFSHSVNCSDRVSVKIDHGSVNRPPIFEGNWYGVMRPKINDILFGTFQAGCTYWTKTFVPKVHICVLWRYYRSRGALRRRRVRLVVAVHQQQTALNLTPNQLANTNTSYPSLKRWARIFDPLMLVCSHKHKAQVFILFLCCVFSGRVQAI